MAQIAVLSSTTGTETPVMAFAESSTVTAKMGEKPARAAVKVPDAVAKIFSPAERDGILKQLNKTLEAFDTHVSLSLDDKTHQTIIKVIDNESGKVVRQIPTEQLMRISERITELLGVIYDEKM
jgi:flagellar protein FlaG